MLPVSGTGLFSWIAGADPFIVVALWALGFGLTAFVFNMVTKDYSWVDRLWSTLPIGFVWYYAWWGGFTSELIIIAIIVTLWGSRLTFNFARKGGYAGAEDYRWKVLEKRINNKVLWTLFNFSFISVIQLGLFVLFTMPVYRIVLYSSGVLNVWFLLAALLALGLLTFETIADQQQWNFHQAKHEAKKSGKVDPQYAQDIEEGFLSHGLFSVSRHPNYFGELGFWWAVWLMAWALVGNPIAGGLLGPCALTILFIGSTIFTESLTSAKYPEYKAYKKRVSPIIPFFARKK